MKIKSQKDFFAGLLFLGIGIVFSLGASTYRLGTASGMGPGYFPLIMGIVMAILGIMIAFNALVMETEGGDKIGRWAWKPIACVLGANFVFGVLMCGLPSIKLPAMGMIVGIYALTIIASLASKRFIFGHVLILTTVLAVGCYFVFIVLLKLLIPVWPAFITG